MGTSATRAKQKYNSKNYEKITLTISPDLAKKFKDFATKNNLSQPQFLQKILIYFLQNEQILNEKNSQIIKLETEKNELQKMLNDYTKANQDWANAYNSLENNKLKLANALQKNKNKMIEMQVNDNKVAYWIGGFALVIGFILGKFL